MALRAGVYPTTLHERSSLDKSHHTTVDSVLKDLKLCSRRLSTIVGALAVEVQILDRLHYKNSNQHRSSLFARRVSEIRRYTHRLQDFQICEMVDNFRQAFFGEAVHSNMKSMKGSWSHYPEEKYVSHVGERLSSFLELSRKTDHVLCKAFKVFTFSMQTGAFIQLILTLTAITSRLSALVKEMTDLVQLALSLVARVLSVFKAVLPTMKIEGNLNDGSSENASDVHSSSQPKPERRSGDSVVSAPTPGLEIMRIERKTLVKDAKEQSQPSVKEKCRNDGPSSQLKKKKKKLKKDEIDDIFGM